MHRAACCARGRAHSDFIPRLNGSGSPQRGNFAPCSGVKDTSSVAPLDSGCTTVEEMKKPPRKTEVAPAFGTNDGLFQTVQSYEITLDVLDDADEAIFANGCAPLQNGASGFGHAADYTIEVSFNVQINHGAARSGN